MTYGLHQEEKYGDSQGAPHQNNPPVGATGVFGLEADGHGLVGLGLQGLAEGKKNTFARQVDVEWRYLTRCDSLLNAINLIDLPLLTFNRLCVGDQKGSPALGTHLTTRDNECACALTAPLLGLESVTEGKLLLGKLFLLDLQITPLRLEFPLVTLQVF